MVAALEAVPGANVAVMGDKLPTPSEGPAWYFIDGLSDQASGFELCRRLRRSAVTSGSYLTLIIDTNDHTARSRAMAVGADDYILGPLTPSLLIARLLQYAGAPGKHLERIDPHWGLKIDPKAHQARSHGRLIPLHPNELRMLQIFLENPNRLLGRGKIIELLGKRNDITDQRTVDVWVGRLRRRLEVAGAKGLLRTVRSMGYVFDTPEVLAEQLP